MAILNEGSLVGGKPIESTEGAQKKANQAEQNAKDYTDAQVAGIDLDAPVTSVNSKIGDVVITAEDVNLGNVPNYGVAAQAESETGTANNRFMTPLRTKQAIDAISPVKSVAGKTGDVVLNASDVGAETPTGSQQKANQAEQNAKNASAPKGRTITAGNGLTGGGDLSANRTITLGTPGTITNSTTNSVTSTGHTHALTVTKGDVGLGSVQNYGIATQAEAEAGTATNKYMTPQRVRQAIESLGGRSVIKSIQRGTTTVSDYAMVTINSVDMEKSVLNFSFRSEISGSGEVTMNAAGAMTVFGEISTATRLYFEKGHKSFTTVVSWEVIEYV